MKREPPASVAVSTPGASPVVLLNGKPWAGAPDGETLSPFDRGLQFGDGLFETM